MERLKELFEIEQSINKKVNNRYKENIQNNHKQEQLLPKKFKVKFVQEELH